MSSNFTIAEIDEAIANAAKFQSISVDGEMTTHQNILSLMKVRDKLKCEEEIKSGERSTTATFDLSKQSF